MASIFPGEGNSMRPDISEFSYGYAVTKAFVERWRPHLTAAPVFPSLLEEGQVGYDVQLQRRGIPLFLQFKLSECIVRSTAVEFKHQLPVSLPFYRMLLRLARHSDQHELLCDLEATGAKVRYVAPMFHTTDQFNQAYLARETAALDIRKAIRYRPST